MPSTHPRSRSTVDAGDACATPPASAGRVLHVGAGQIMGGVEGVLVEIARQAQGGEVCAEFALCGDAAPAAALRQAGARPHILPTPRLSRPWSVRRARRELDALLAAIRPDAVVLHSGWVQALLGPAVRRRGLPSLLYLHDAPSTPTLVDRAARWSRPASAAANSAFTASRGVGLYGLRRPPLVIAPPVAPPQGPEDGARDTLRRTLGAAPGTTVLLQLARLAPYKGQDVLVEAAARLDRSADWVVWIAGGAQRPEEHAFARRLHARALELGLAERVRFLGARDDARALLSAADLFVHANSGAEAFGMACVEAMYAGLPVVASASGASPSVVPPQCGVLVPPGDAAALAAVLGELLADPVRRRALGAAGPARALAMCDPAARVRDLHRAALGAAARP